MTDLPQTLKDIVGTAGFLAGDDVEPRYFNDVMDNPGIKPELVLRPSTTDEVSKIMAACHAAGQPVVLQGGMTGLVGATVPQQGEIVLSMERMTAIEEIDAASGSMTVQSGAVLQNIEEAADDAGLKFPLDLGARGSCRIGGNISTNAGGNRVLRFGMTRNLVLGLEAVLPDGTIIDSCKKLMKNNTGYDLKHLFIGSEGTLGVVTRAVLRLFPKPKTQIVALCGMESFEQVRNLLGYMREQHGGELSAFEVMWADYYQSACTHLTTAKPLPDTYPYYVLTEIMGADPDKDAEHFGQSLNRALEDGIIVDAVISQSLGEVKEIWKIRDLSTEVTGSMMPMLGYDVSLPIGDIPEFVDTLGAQLAEKFPESKTIYFGHLGDGNLHVITTAGADTQEGSKFTDSLIYEKTGAANGSISAEHGIGMLKRPYLHRSRSEEEIALMRTLKNAMDPKGILNPGRIFEA